MEWSVVISLITSIWGKIFPDVIIVCEIKEIQLGNYIIRIENGGNTDLEILEIKTNDKDINELPGWDKFDFPFILVKKNSISRKFFLSKEDHYKKPEKISIKYKINRRVKSKIITV